MDKTVNTMTHLVNGLLKAGHDPRDIMIGFHNAFVHGQNLSDHTDYELDDDDINLGKLFEGFDMCIKALKNMKENNRT